jgi:aryl-alcohol dehydrogenase-like predicted oxidoreductase
MNFFDTAPLYGVSGERTSEARLGHALCGIRRD